MKSKEKEDFYIEVTSDKNQLLKLRKYIEQENFISETEPEKRHKIIDKIIRSKNIKELKKILNKKDNIKSNIVKPNVLLCETIKKNLGEIIKKVQENLELEREFKINILIKHYSTKPLQEEIDFGKRFKKNKSIIELDMFLNNELKNI